ncbi:glycosyltransferase family 4 protein [Shewanella baltica]|uniref:glycosyltransferase family 4 protein n=1 Tax=Shewanella baltica TaxID=62322 RepID=UPI00217DE53D|nr:glycosyltransferase family 4 protein [Shewanella baltica]MCS6206982.1 glycosyltransferase [Shewanella baltica]
MKVLHVSHSDISGGAARAAYRLHRAQLAADIDSRMLVRSKKSDDWTVQGPVSPIEKLVNIVRGAIGQQLMRLQRSQNVNFHSGDLLPSNLAKNINASDADVVHLHWVAGETMSIEDIGRIKKPIVWTMHDMWPFCGAEHVTDYDMNVRWRAGYTKANRGHGERGLDLDRYVWQRKLNAWQNPMHIVAPSHWLADCAKGSKLFQDKSITVIPNTLNIDLYKPLKQDFCRQALNLPDDKKIILFGAMGGGLDPNKGYDLLVAALGHLSLSLKADDVLCVVFGQSEPQQPSELPFKTQWLGHIHDDATLVLLYNAATVMVVPSKQEAFGQTASEAQACGIPVVAFNCTGLTDVVEHQQTGYLAKAYDSEDMAAGLQWLLANPAECQRLGNNARLRAEELWAINTGIEQYLAIYKAITNAGL